MQTKNRPLLLVFTAATNAAAQIKSIATHRNFNFEQIFSEKELVPDEVQQAEHKPGEPIGGRRGHFFSQIVEKQPAMLIFDLDNEAIPWGEWIPSLKSSAATRRIPVVGFTAKGDSAAIDFAQRRGADFASSWAQFIPKLPQLMERLARIPDRDAIEAACAEPLSPLAIKGLELFNAGEYFEAHEDLEDAWNEDQGAGRELYRGILQVGVAYLQIERGNYNGAVKMLLRVRQWLDPLPEICRGVHVGRLRDDAQRVNEQLQQLGRERIDEFDHSLFKPVIYSLGNREKLDAQK